MQSRQILLPQEIIRHQRDGQTLSADEINFFIAGITNNSITDAQAAAFAMAVLLASLALVTLGLKTFLEWKYADALSGRSRRH